MPHELPYDLDKGTELILAKLAESMRARYFLWSGGWWKITPTSYAR